MITAVRSTTTTPAPTAEAGAALDILVVDDSAASRHAMELAIRALGHRCRAASDGLEASRLLAQHPADVVISDWEMPHMNGAELCRLIRQAEKNGHYTYFILLSAFHDRLHLLEGMAAGADDYQKKPVDLDELEARLVSAARVVGLHRRLAERETILRRDSSRYRTASRTDALTGAGNRAHLDEELAAAWSRAQRYRHRFSLAILDVDHFKELNDCLGHLAGDEALRQVVEATRKALRTSDSVFRYGGEEFVVLLPEQTLADAISAVERVRAQIAATKIAASKRGGRVLSVSGGVAELDFERDASVADWLARADAALYAAKANGRDRVESNPPLRRA